MNKKVMLAVVIVEDSMFFADLILRILKRNGFVVESRVVSTKDELQDVLNKDCWDIILSDNVMPEFNALGALKLRNGICGDTPFMIVSEDISQKELTEAFEKGCSFFLPKDRISELPEAIRKVITEHSLKQNYQ
jgi:CheY-like chemotaxis protein